MKENHRFIDCRQPREQYSLNMELDKLQITLYMQDLGPHSQDHLFVTFDLGWDLGLKSGIITPSPHCVPLCLCNSVISPINISSTLGRCFL